ncbi:ATP-binding cassette domain-containing protein [Lacrimispora sp.]|jgi:NitT/TauT family transport system ATP-binding protein|uniref:ATP-binding cassette domain-containing protein n=1 Tax=Lacrimispora sp. TaxID=2719234 RepID=UPI0028AAD505|nr:ATP-binding cassette domain-containing protein [Lacrimispora sp.]
MIECRKISKAFGNTIVFKDFDYIVGETGLHTVTGPSGRGKTTLARLIMGLEKPDSGEILYKEGICISPVFPENRLIPTMTCLENVEYAAKDRAKSQEMLDLLKLDGWEGAYPGQLSSGMKRRVALARALAYGGNILILDEPFAGLDEALKSHVLELLLHYAKTMPVLLFSHEIALVKPVSLQFLDLQMLPKPN